MTRFITNHTPFPESEPTKIVAGGEFSSGGAPTDYDIQISGNRLQDVVLSFKTTERPGVTMEHLIAICIDRLEHLQRGPHPCEENQDALSELRRVLQALHRRTKRVAKEKKG